LIWIGVTGSRVTNVSSPSASSIERGDRSAHSVDSRLRAPCLELQVADASRRSSAAHTF